MNFNKKCLVEKAKTMEKIRDEIRYIASRSSGSGGQHVNKVSSRVSLLFHVNDSQYLTVVEKEVILKKLSNLISKEGVLQLSCDSSRSQHRNKTIVTERFFQLLNAALEEQKPRKETTLPASIKHKRRLNKAAKSVQKEFRRKVNPANYF